MPDITFRAKAQAVYTPENALAYHTVKVPTITRSHCDMDAFRRHPQYASYANSDLFPAIIKRAFASTGIGDHIRLDHLPANVKVDTSGFLAAVVITI